MKTKTLIACAAALTLLIFACRNNESSDKKKHQDLAEPPASTGQQSNSSNSLYSSKAAVANKDSTRKFIRTAELKFKVTSVEKATYYIEDITTQAGGFVGNRG